MSRKLFIAGNWKMNTLKASAVELAGALVESIGGIEDIDLAVAPPYVYLEAVSAALKGSRIALAAQSAFWEAGGAFTGEISTEMLADVGCEYVILGHSERRHVIGEENEQINLKVLKALAGRMDVILCVGELLEQRQADRTMEVVTEQVKIGLEGVSSICADGKSLAERLTVAYEPVWAIGTGETATPEQAQEVHEMIRSLLGEMYDEQLASQLRIQYGGSVKPANARDLLSRPDIDGALVGGASLKAGDFEAIVRAGM